MTQEQKDRNNLFNEGYQDATEETGCKLEFYENDENYRRGYDAGEADNEADGADYDAPSSDEMKIIYGDPKDRL